MFGMCCLGKELCLGTLWRLSPAQDFWSPKQKEGMQVSNTICNSLKGKHFIAISSVLVEFQASS